MASQTQLLNCTWTIQIAKPCTSISSFPWWGRAGPSPAMQGRTVLSTLCGAGCHTRWGHHQGHDTTPLAQCYVRQWECPAGPHTMLLHGGLCGSGELPDTTAEVYETRGPSSCWQGRRDRPPERRPGRPGNALTLKEWAARLLVVDVSCSWLLLPQVSWFMCFIDIKYKVWKMLLLLEDSHRLQLPLWSWFCLLTNSTEPQLHNPILPVFETIRLRSFLDWPLFSFSWIQLTTPLSTQDHGWKTESRPGFCFQPFPWAGSPCLPTFAFFSPVWCV